MKGEIILGVFAPNANADWYRIQTDKAIYNMRLGCFEKLEDLSHIDVSVNNTVTKEIKEATIEAVFADSEWMYMLLNNGFVLISGWSEIANDGMPGLGLLLRRKQDFDDGFFGKEVLEIS